MKLYLSSYMLGDKEYTDQLIAMASTTNKRVAVISNALDFSDEHDRRARSEQKQIDAFSELGMDAEILDLRECFDDQEGLRKKLDAYDMWRTMGGNTFVLRQAFHLSGFDAILLDAIEQGEDKIYGGYSAGICLLCSSMRGLAIVDDPDQKPYGDEHETIWEGLGLLSYMILPHYDSDNPESEDIHKEVDFMIENKMPFIVMRDGEVIIV